MVSSLDGHSALDWPGLFLLQNCLHLLPAFLGRWCQAYLEVSIEVSKEFFLVLIPESARDSWSLVERERERERDYTYPALRLIQVLLGHPLADPKDETVSSIQRRTSL